MPKATAPLRRLTIFLIAEQIDDESDILKEPDLYERFTMRVRKSALGTLYIKPSETSLPSWVHFLAPAVGSLPKQNLQTTSASAVWLIRRRGRFFAITFGHGRYMLQDGCIDERFGLRSTLNAVDASRIRSIDRTTFERNQRHTREQIAREADFNAFGLRVDQDLLKAVTGTPADSALGRQFSGRDALSVSLNAYVDEVPALLDQYLDLSARTAYQKRYPWIDNIAQVNDRQLQVSLLAELAELIREGETASVWLDAPEVLDWDVVEYFKYSEAPSASEYSELKLEDYLRDRSRGDTLSEQHIAADRAYCRLTTNPSTLHSWPIRRCLFAELIFNDEQFVLSDGSWYQINRNYASRVVRAVAAIPRTKLELPTFAMGEKEGDYNQRAVSLSKGRYALMDKRLVKAATTARGQVEACDLFAKGALIHVKKYGRSSTLSHLFAQGAVSARLLHLDEGFREDFNKKLPASHRFEDWRLPIDPRKIEVAYVIMADRDPFRLPFFSQVNLKTAVDSLSEVRFPVTLTPIKLADA